jgi:hypothetical protein
MNRFRQIFKTLNWIKRSVKNAPIPPIPPTPPSPEDKKRWEQESAKHYKKFSDNLRELSTELAKRGWYANMDMPIKFFNTLRQLLKANNLKGVDNMMMAYFQHHLEPVENEIMSAFPLRAQILSAAFRAHTQKTYTLSVPVFLIQADGICSELLGVGIYARTKRVPQTASAIKQFEDDELMSSLLEPLKIAGALNAYADEKHQYPDIFNRHEILHGKSLNYANELNSFRAISLLSYLCSTVSGAFLFKEVSKDPQKYI